MTFVERILLDGDPFAPTLNGRQSARRRPIVLVVENATAIADALRPVCDFLDIAIERLDAGRNLEAALRELQPMGIIAELDCHEFDGCHVMITVAALDRSLPILLLLGDDPAMAGAADAVEELWQLDAVTKLRSLPNLSGIVDFLFRAGRLGGCIRLMPV